MLVLSRKLGEKIRIGDDIVVTLLKTQGNTVRLGIEAPAHVRVLRAELPPREQDAKSVPAERRSPAIRLSEPKSADHRQQVSHTIASATTRRAEPPHPARWSVASMRERVRSAVNSPDTRTLPPGKSTASR